MALDSNPVSDVALPLTEPPGRRSVEPGARVKARALLLWPGLDRRALARTRGDLRKVARLVARRTLLPEPVIERMLDREADDSPSWGR